MNPHRLPMRLLLSTALAALPCAAIVLAAPPKLPRPAAKALPKAAAAKAAALKTPVPLTDAQGWRVARALGEALRSRVSSPGGQLKLYIQPTMRSREGFFAQIAIAGRPAKVRKLQISELSLSSHDVQVDVPYLFSTGKVRTLSSRTSLRAVVTEDDVTQLLAQGKGTRDMGLRVRFNPDGSMRVSGRLNYTLLSGPVEGLARLRLTNDFKVNLDVISLKLRGVEVPGFVRRQLMSRVNPVINYEDVPFRPHFSGLSVQGTRATLRA